MISKRIKTAAANQTKRIREAAARQTEKARAAAGEYIERARKHPAGATAIYGVILAAVGTMYCAAVCLQILAITTYSFRAIIQGIGIIKKTVGQYYLKKRHIAHNLPERIRAAWKFRAEIMKENRGGMLYA